MFLPMLVLSIACVGIVGGLTLRASGEKALAERFLAAVRRDDAAAARAIAGGRAREALGTGAKVPGDSALAPIRGALEVSTSWNITVSLDTRCIEGTYRPRSGRAQDVWLEVARPDGDAPFRVVEVFFARPVAGPCSSD